MLEQKQPLAVLSAEAALQKLRAGHALREYHIWGRLDLLSLSPDFTYFPYPLVIENCRVDDLQGHALQYQQGVELRDTQFGRADFFFGYFPKGLLIEHCAFESYLDFQAGGHNQPGHAVRLLNNCFKGFVNFFDCLYESTVQIEDNDFQAGTNLLGMPEGYPVEFAVEPLVKRNTGDLYRNDTGERPGADLPSA